MKSHLQLICIFNLWCAIFYQETGLWNFFLFFLAHFNLIDQVATLFKIFEKILSNIITNHLPITSARNWQCLYAYNVYVYVYRWAERNIFAYILQRCIYYWHCQLARPTLCQRYRQMNRHSLADSLKKWNNNNLNRSCYKRRI